ncbi:putative G2/M phase-specific E3 ubiquitin-protein ligase-like [Apostichopus japonicus]|uniref:HECT-type E3 ubiquitin transferase n=1 Tax=Stichopus japonicus TaxID=307972 RepID=A0A2G8K6Y9_STIJA|nr:putative G2/M phase-specific E3 ubiquitin-protein ligase-like [Apostichopus japonicus]
MTLLQEKIPKTFVQNDLTESGLGQRRVQLPTSASPEDVRDILLQEFPKLAEAGGFEYMKANASSKKLEPIPLPNDGFSASELRVAAKQSRIYLRPIQHNLQISGGRSVTSTNDAMELKEKCSGCHQMVSQTKLRRHLNSQCPSRGNTNVPVTMQVSSDEELPLVFTDENAQRADVNSSKTFENSLDDRGSSDLPSSSRSHQPSTSSRTDQHSVMPYMSYVQDCISGGDLSSDDEDGALSAAIIESLQTNRAEVVTGKTLAEILKVLAEAIDSQDSSRFNVSRAKVWECAVRGFKRLTFEPTKRLSVHFTDSMGSMEGAVDEGGPRREFLRLLAKALQNSPIFEGSTERRSLSLNASALNQDLYKVAGTMIAVILVHGGPSVSFFSKTTYNVIAYGFSAAETDTEDIGDPEIKNQITAILKATSKEELENAISKAEVLIAMAGCFRQIKHLHDQIGLGRDLTRFYLVNRVRSAYESFLEGMKALNLLGAIRESPKVFEPCFHGEDIKITADIMENIFVYDLSPEGSNKRAMEENAVAFWLDFLLDIQENNSSVTFENILVFATGLDKVPVTGFDPSPRLEFIHEPDVGEKECSQFPKAHTCSCVLKIPLHPTYELFKTKMEFGIQSAPGFGFA